jgi:co-chaperonin GroES (HSP10)
MKAINNWVLAEKIKETIKTESGMQMTGADKNAMRYGKGKVLSVGENAGPVAEGDIIYYDSARSHTVLIEGTWVTVIRGVDIVVVSDSTDCA